MAARAAGPVGRAASAVRRWLHARVAGGRRAGEDGFILLESMIAISVITVVMSAVGAEFVGGMLASSQQRAQQGAVQVATSSVEQIRSLHASDLVTGRDATSVASQFTAAPAAVQPWLAAMDRAVDSSAPAGGGTTAAVPTTGTTVTPGTVTYTVNQYLGWCSEPTTGSNRSCVPVATLGGAPANRYLRAVVAVTWTGQRCASSVCSYVTSTLVSTASDQTFRVNAPAYATPVVVNPGDQTSVVGDTVSVQLKVKDGTGVPLFTWAQGGGTLPAGLSVSSSGLISGTVQAPAGTYSATVQVTDAFIRSDSQVVTWTVKPALVLTDPGPQATLINASTSLTLSATGGAGGPYTYSILNGTLPPGLTLAASTGVISGQTTVAGTYTVTAQVADSATPARTATRSFTWTVSAPPIAASNPGRQIDTVGTAITPLTLTASGGSGSYVWSDPTGSLPPGLSISRDGVITGTPTTLRSAAPAGNVLYRVDTAGPAQRAGNAPDWTSYAGLVNGGTAKNWGTTVPFDGTIPAGTPPGIFTTERYGDQDWNLPVAAGKHLTVRLYFANQYDGTTQVGQRVFNVAIDGVTKLDHFDIVAAAGNRAATMRSFDVTSDGDGLDIDLRSISENALVNGIEVLDRDAPATTGSPNVTLQVADAAAATRTATVAFDWAVVARPTVTAPGTSFTATVGQPVSLPLTTSCPNSPCTYTLDNGPGGLSIDTTGNVSGTVAGPAASYGNVTVTVTDADGATGRSAVFTVVVKGAPTVSGSAQSDTVGQSVSVSLSTTCPNGPCSYTLNNGPPGLSVTSSGVVTGTLGGTPATYSSVTVTATDANGVSTTSSPFTWVVYAAPSLSGLTATAVGETATPSVAVGYTCAATPCTITLSGTLASSSIGLGLSAAAVNPNANSVRSLSVGSASGTVYVTGLVSTSAVTGALNTSQTYGVSLAITDTNGASPASSSATWTAYSTPTISTPGPVTTNQNATVQRSLTYYCPTVLSRCTITVTGLPSGVGLTTNGSTGNNGTTSLQVNSILGSGTVYLSGRVSNSAARATYPVTVTIVSGTTTISSSGVWTVP